ncbi:hypothetical protein [Agromyces flavus]|nr:hypothetical protein [Agromyces flavus]GGI45106.1 hypothetical protein GCM10010932_07960 [Agromyces flavus]SDT19443.1 hypothetical protein SAMN04489721_2728 [Agromyces flavus]
MSRLDEDRLARLQRAAYGADASDQARAAAATELAALRRASGRAGATEGVVERPVEPTADPTPTARSGAPAAPSTAPSASARHRRTASAVLLLAGVAIGWAFGTVGGLVATSRTVPAAQTEAWRVFELPPLNGHPARFPQPDVELVLDLDSRRVLASRWDGLRVTAVRTVDGRDACLVLVAPLAPPASACTVDGRFPVAGLVAETETTGTGAYSATWDVSGRVSIAPAVPAE